MHRIEIINLLNQKQSNDVEIIDNRNRNIKYIKLIMLENAYKQWASSLWRLEIYGWRNDQSYLGCIK